MWSFIMKIQDLIKKLQNIEKQNPNAVCISSNYDGCSHPTDCIKQVRFKNKNELP